MFSGKSSPCVARGRMDTWVDGSVAFISLQRPVDVSGRHHGAQTLFTSKEIVLKAYGLKSNPHRVP